MEKKSKADVFNQKMIEQSTRFVQQVIAYQQESIEQIARFDKDIDNIFKAGRRDIDKIHYQAMNKTREAVNAIWEEEERKIAEIRASKPPPSYLNPPKPVPATSNFAKLKLKNRKTVKISSKWKANKIPRPVWGIIFEYCDVLSLAKMERVCKSFFLLINPMCACSDTKGDPSCKSFWTQAIHLGVKEKYPDANCSYFRRVLIREKMTELFIRSLTVIKNIGCNKGIHDWEVHPENTGFNRCPSCFKGAKKSEYCAEICSEHKKMCQNTIGRFSVCSKHACIICKLPELRNYCKIVGHIKDECTSYTVHPAVKLNFKENLD